MSFAELARHELASIELASAQTVSARAAATTPLGSASAVVGAIADIEVRGAAGTPLGAASAVAHLVDIARASASTPLGAAAARARTVTLARAAAGSPLGVCAVRATVLRYELRGEVRLSGILVNRRVRAYSRATGALLGEADTVVGRFHVPAGFAAAECYVTPIDLTEGANDWLPPTANRITSVLADDTA